MPAAAPGIPLPPPFHLLQQGHGLLLGKMAFTAGIWHSSGGGGGVMAFNLLKPTN
jgi:hypothetical protein